MYSNSYWCFQPIGIEEGPELGTGSFAQVHLLKVREVRRFHSQRSLSISHSTASVSERSLQSASTVFDPNTDPESRSYYYAVKKVRQDLTGSGRKHGELIIGSKWAFYLFSILLIFSWFCSCNRFSRWSTISHFSLTSTHCEYWRSRWWARKQKLFYNHREIR